MIRCTCGAYPPEDARFCHKCARPLYEVAAPEPESVPEVLAEAPVVRETVQDPEPRIAGSQALRSAMWGAFLGMMLFLIPGLNVFAVVLSPLICGLLTVWFFSRRTGIDPTIREGAQLGSIGGLFAYSILLLQFTALFLTLRNPQSKAALENQLAQFFNSQPQAAEAMETFSNPAALVLGLVLILGLFLVLPSIAGAAMAAFRERRR
jgi:hypothetical protein